MKAFRADGARWFSRPGTELWDSWFQQPEFCEWMCATADCFKGDLAFFTRPQLSPERLRAARVLAVCAALYRFFHAGRVSFEIEHALRVVLRP